MLLIPVFSFAQRDWSPATIGITRVADGCNRLFVDNRVAVVAHVGNNGVLLIDAAYEQTVPQLKESVAALSDLPVTCFLPATFLSSIPAMVVTRKGL